eukprot:2487935-Amphidinium_carterae.1
MSQSTVEVQLLYKRTTFDNLFRGVSPGSIYACQAGTSKYISVHTSLTKQHSQKYTVATCVLSTLKVIGNGMLTNNSTDVADGSGHFC